MDIKDFKCKNCKHYKGDTVWGSNCSMLANSNDKIMIDVYDEYDVYVKEDFGCVLFEAIND